MYAGSRWAYWQRARIEKILTRPESRGGRGPWFKIPGVGWCARGRVWCVECQGYFLTVDHKIVDSPRISQCKYCKVVLLSLLNKGTKETFLPHWRCYLQW